MEIFHTNQIKRDHNDRGFNTRNTILELILNIRIKKISGMIKIAANPLVIRFYNFSNRSALVHLPGMFSVCQRTQR